MSVKGKPLAVCPLASGSKGNSYWIESGNTSILVDAGISLRQLILRTEEMGRDLADIDHLFITHGHRDHTNGVRVLLKKYNPTIWASRGTLHCLRSSLGKNTSVKMITGKIEQAGDFEVYPVAVSHDAEDTYAFRFNSENGSAAIFTDLGKWDGITAEAASGVDILVCEANYDPQMLRDGPYTQYLKNRIRSIYGHLSNEEGAALALEAVRSGTKNVILGHLSENNNMPLIARRVFEERLNGLFSEVRIETASQSRPGPWVTLSFVNSES